MATPARTAALLVEVYAIGQPGTVGIMVNNVDKGPHQLTPAEAVRTLRSAATIIEENPELLG